MSGVTSSPTRRSASSSDLRPITHQGQEMSETKSILMRLFIGCDGCLSSAFQPISRFEYPCYHGKACREKTERHCQTHSHAHIRGLIEAPAKTADQIHNRIE